MFSSVKPKPKTAGDTATGSAHAGLTLLGAAVGARGPSPPLGARGVPDSPTTLVVGEGRGEGEREEEGEGRERGEGGEGESNLFRAYFRLRRLVLE